MSDTVFPTQGHTNVGHMNVVGYFIAGGIAFVLLPVLPLLVVLYLLGEYGESEQAEDAEPAGG